MGRSSFKFDENALQQVVRASVTNLVASYQQLFDELRVTHAGRPVGEIKPVLQARWQSIAGGEITDPELSEWAQHVSDGTNIHFSYDG